jgi:hypothetical protein
MIYTGKSTQMTTVHIDQKWNGYASQERAEDFSFLFLFLMVWQAFLSN